MQSAHVRNGWETDWSEKINHGTKMNSTLNYAGAVDWRGCRMHSLYLCRGVRPPYQWVSLIWHKAIWWWGTSNAGALGNAESPLLPSLRGLPWLGVVATERVLSMSQTKLYCVFILNRIVRNRTSSFPSPRLVASPRLKNLVYPTIYP